MSTHKIIKVLIAEENAIFLNEASELIRKEHDMEIVGKVDGRSQIKKALNLNPDIIVLNPSLFSPEDLPDMLHNIKKRGEILLLLRKDADDKTLMDALTAGVKGYIKSSDLSRHLPAAIRAVEREDLWAERRILNRLVTGSYIIKKNIEYKLKTISSPLTDKEKEIIHEVLKGASNREISKRFHVTEMTVKTHLYRIFKKMKVRSRAQAIAYLIYP